MRVITGTARGRKLVAPPGEHTRPTTDMAKEGIFSIVQFEVEGASVLDLFAGSGQMGIEALSRGARQCVFVDNARISKAAQRENLAHTGFLDKAHMLMKDAVSYLQSSPGPFDLAFIDPPYDQGIIDKVLPMVASAMSESGAILCESSNRENLPETAGDFVKKREYRYGKTKVTLYRRPEEDSE